MLIKIGDVVKWDGDEYLVVGNDSSDGDYIQLRELTDAGYNVRISEIQEVVEEHSYGGGHVWKD